MKSKRILVVRATTNGKWMLPGGLLENYEISTPWLGAARELKEESGFTISLGPAHLNSRNGDCYLYEHWFDFDGPNMNRHSIFASRPETKDKDREIQDFGFVKRVGDRYVVTSYAGKDKTTQTLRGGTKRHLDILSPPPPLPQPNTLLPRFAHVGLQDTSTKSIFVVLNSNGEWMLPGGLVKQGDHPWHSAIEELINKSGYSVHLDARNDVPSIRGRHLFKTEYNFGAWTSEQRYDIFETRKEANIIDYGFAKRNRYQLKTTPGGTRYEVTSFQNQLKPYQVLMSWLKEDLDKLLE